MGPDDTGPLGQGEDFGFYFECLAKLLYFSQDPSGPGDEDRMKERKGGGKEAEEEAGAMSR